MGSNPTNAILKLCHSPSGLKSPTCHPDAQILVIFATKMSSGEGCVATRASKGATINPCLHHERACPEQQQKADNAYRYTRAREIKYSTQSTTLYLVALSMVSDQNYPLKQDSCKSQRKYRWHRQQRYLPSNSVRPF